MPILSVVIPVRAGSNPYFTLRSLGEQSFQSIEILISQDIDGNANIARNAGYRLASPCTSIVLFCDDDIQWERDGIAHMVAMLEQHPEASYSYGTYEMGGKLYCNQEFDANILPKRNYISTMTVIRREHFPGWDESIGRLQDWELFRRLLLFFGRIGVHCKYKIFVTNLRNGITRGGGVSYEDAYRSIVEKHSEDSRLQPHQRQAGIH
jgi:glycosyltransferase involved in cell wall biosynthesis